MDGRPVDGPVGGLMVNLEGPYLADPLVQASEHFCSKVLARRRRCSRGSE